MPRRAVCLLLAALFLLLSCVKESVPAPTETGESTENGEIAETGEHAENGKDRTSVGNAVGAGEEKAPAPDSGAGTARFADRAEIDAVPEGRENSPDSFTLCFGGVPLPRAEERFWLPVTADFGLENLTGLSAEDGEGGEASVLLDAALPDADFARMMRESVPARIAVFTESAHASFELVFTTLHVLSVRMDQEKRRTVGTTPMPAAFEVWEAAESGVRYTASRAEVSVRGASSASLSKTGFRLTLLDEAGNKKNLPLLGMRRDDDWILYASYSDNTHVRDMVGWRLWERMTASSDALNAAPMGAEYAELILGNRYYGLYVLMERVDAKMLSLDAGRGDSLFKCVSWDVPGSAGLARQKPDSAAYSSMEKKYPDSSTEPSAQDGTGNPWDNLAEYVRLCYEADGKEFAAHIGEVADLHNMLEYWLFLNITMAADNTWKNTYYASVDGKMTVYPWDLDITFGLGWNGERANNYLYENSGAITASYDFQCGRRLLKYVPGASDYVKERWEKLMSGHIADADTLIADAREFWDLLHSSGAWARNLERWPQTSTADSLSYFENAVQRRVKYLDKTIRTLP